ncbi:MAG: tetratricopeptide repeat protein, partial [Chloroflexi bacterium]|nr:tetratricopeptide repeat protein [Chloroflexota bacterium]
MTTPVMLRLLPVLLCFLPGCFLFPRGHLDITETIRPRYEEALSLFETNRYAESERAFLSILNDDSKSILARYHLGLSLYHQQKLDDAQSRFQQIVGLGRVLPHGYHGMGLVALERRNRRFEAIDWFRQALRRDKSFVPSQWALARTRLEVRNGIFGAFSLGQVRDEVRRVIALAPEHPEAHFALGLTYYEYGIVDDATTAIPLFERQIEVNPGHRDARYQLGLAYIDTDRIAEGISTLESVIAINPDWKIRIAQVVTEARLRNMLVPADSIFLALTELPDRERRLYLDLKLIQSPNELARANPPPLDETTQNAFSYWKSQDPTPTTADNPKLVEHCRRVAHARRFFGRGMWPWDKRGEVYIRYGAPQSRQTITSDRDADGNSATARFGLRQVDRWTYITPDLTFDFVDQGSNFAFDTPLSPATGDISSLAEAASNDAGVHSDLLAEDTPSVYASDIEDGPPLRYSYSLAVFRNDDGTAAVEVDYAVPASELTFRENQAAIESALAVFDGNWRELESVVQNERLTISPDADVTHQVALYRRSLTAPPGQHQFAIRVTDEESRRSAVARQPVRVPDYSLNELSISDIRLVTKVTASTTGRFTRGGRQLIPNPAGVFGVTQPITLYFEVYHLKRDSNGRTSAEIEYTVFPLSGENRPILTATGETFANRKEGAESALFQDEEGTEETLRRDVAIALTGAETGRYALQVMVS